MNNVFVSCKESRIENNRSFYGCFNIGAFDPVQSLTVANALRRTLLSECPGLGIISVTIDNVSHEYSTLPGMRESVLDLLLNLKEIVFRSNFDKPVILAENFQNNFNVLKRNPKKPLIGYLKVKGPGVIRARDLRLPPFIQCVDPNQYIATLAEDGVLSMKFILMEGKGYLIQKTNSLVDNDLVKKRSNFLSDIQKIEKNHQSNLSLNNSGTNLNFKLKSHQSNDIETSITNNLLKENSNRLRYKKRSENKPLYLDCVFNPVTKVSYIIEDFNNQVTNDFNSNLNFINNVSSLLESSFYLKTNIGNSVANQNTEFALQKNAFSSKLTEINPNLASDIRNTSITTVVETFTKKELTELASYLHPLQRKNSLHNIVLEIWTNGSVHPREALAIGFQNLSCLFLNLNKTTIF